MNWEAIGAICEVLGFFILIASIYYLSLQIRSSSDQATASAERGVQQDFIQIQDSLLANDRTMRTMRRGLESFQALDDQEKFFFHMKISLFVNHFEGVLRMKEKGLVSEDMVRTQGNIVLSLIGSPGGREFWGVAGGTFQNLSMAYIKKNLESGADWGSMREIAPYMFEASAYDA